MESLNGQKFRVGLVQMSCALDPNENLEKAIWKTREAAGRGAQIVCLQELFRSQYFCREENAELFALAEPIPGPTALTLIAHNDASLREIVILSLEVSLTASICALVIGAPLGTALAVYRFLGCLLSCRHGVLCFRDRCIDDNDVAGRRRRYKFLDSGIFRQPGRYSAAAGMVTDVDTLQH